ncbi:MarR family winged helix-turn-helix transcriptional regulator [Dermatophilus congolensis]|uniref:Transcriptional repressor MprA n=1 Tax=Dermatophilus congolensis TaxID=1863 RepID=A0A239VMM5_9MICO|nr:MarR family transcriptional regulator [Dermatophilus congolensis]MBO3129546.1 MarR family transcriptional regulator [Dermatophilus congolensis]MBO3131821.1 MarR family transcriptional regulator [Dermatophilus congolensis]MBO3134022.1 MarR family transcriptional regulator [Dermatophilus congolensis]MBO3136254.1 MarR family transcriptional regulator [Dermatophilus congolensis]MBO3138501.1 MarR family transcriptional regulator [Dermatophilus congolensis]
MSGDCKSGGTHEAGNAVPEPQEPRWLDSDEREAWVGFAGLLIKLPTLLDGQLERDSGLRFFEYMVLAMLSEQEPPQVRMSHLAVLTGGSLSRLSHVAKRLEREGLIVRATDPADRRSTLARLTPLGREKVQAAAPGHVARVRELLMDPLTREQICRFGEITNEILQRVDPEGQVRPGPAA